MYILYMPHSLVLYLCQYPNILKQMNVFVVLLLLKSDKPLKLEVLLSQSSIPTTEGPEGEWSLVHPSPLRGLTSQAG